MTLAIGAVASLGARAAIASSRRGASSSSPGASAEPSRRLAVPSPGRTTRCALPVRGSPGAIFAARDDAVRRVRTRAVAASDPEEPRTGTMVDAMVDVQDPSLSDKSAFDAGERARLSLGESLDLIPAVWRVVRRRWPRVLVAACAMALATGLLLSAPVLCFSVVSLAAVTATFNRKNGRLFAMDAAAQGAVSAAASATLGAVRTVRSFGGESLSFAKFGEDVGKVSLFFIRVWAI